MRLYGIGLGVYSTRLQPVAHIYIYISKKMAFINRDATGEAKIIRVFVRTMNNESIYVPYCMKLELKYAPDKRILYEQFYVQPYNAIPFIVLCDIIVIYSVLQQ